VITGNPMKTRENELRNLLESHEWGFGKFPKFPIEKEDETA
jgi:hypothetical protein